MQIAHHYFENGIAYFTKRINRCISMCALSLLSYFILIIDVPLQPVPMAKLLLSWVTTRIILLSHTLQSLTNNPTRFLRWKAIQDAAFVDPVDGKQKIWSESNVSEDFDMALRLILKGYIVRCVSLSHI